MACLVEAPVHPDTHEIGEGIPHDVPLPRRRLGITRHSVGRDAQLFRAHLRGKELVRQVLLVQEEGEVSVFCAQTNAGKHLGRRVCTSQDSCLWRVLVMCRTVICLQ